MVYASLPLPRRRRWALVVFAVTLTLALVPHPKSPGEGADEQKQQQYLAVAQEVHHGFHVPHLFAPPVGAQISQEEFQQKLAEAENSSVSLTLLGCVGFVMATFYLVNWPDKDIQRISLEVINATISVFGALLLFHTFEEVLEHFVLPELAMWQEVVVSMLHMLFWFALLQLVLAYYSGALGRQEVVLLREDSRSVAEACKSPSTRAKLQQSSDQHLNAIKMNTEAYGILLGHITGFAAKNACSQLQQAMPRSFLWVALTPLMAFLILSSIYRALEHFRHQRIMADGEEDEFESIWRERTAETEDEVIALAVSFAVVQMLRFGVSGELPNVHGEDEFNHSNWSCALLLLVGLVPGLADVARVFIKRSSNAFAQSARKFIRSLSNVPGEEEEDRSRNWCEGIASMSFAWCLHFAVDWFLSSHLDLEGSSKAVISALCVTAFSFVLIFGLDKVADWHYDDEEVDRALRGTIAGLGLLVGISWELCFHASLEGLAVHRCFNMPPTINKMVFAVALALLVLPAWKWYILPMLHQATHGAHGAVYTATHVETHHGHALEDAPTPSKEASNPPKKEEESAKTRRIFARLGSNMRLDTQKQLKRRSSTSLSLDSAAVNLVVA